MIQAYQARVARKVRGTSVTEGQTLYAVRKAGLFFIWSYSDKTFAEAMDAKLEGPKDKADREANWRDSLAQLKPSDRKSMK